MSSVLFMAVVLTLIRVVLFFGQHNVEADFSDSCVNSTDSLTCIRTYEQLYNSLAKSDNSFNIVSALYPAMKPSSVRVFVNVHGPKETEAAIAQYTWSISCLYAALPAPILHLWSLGSILVTPRTQTLNITIPLFCCNVSKKEDERKKEINKIIKGVLAALQDLAISPEIRDPRLNTAECIIEGHQPDIEATGRSFYIRTILWCSFCFCLVTSPLLSAFMNHLCIEAGYCKTLGRQHEARQDSNVNTNSPNFNTGSQGMQQMTKNKAAAAVYISLVLLAILGFLIFNGSAFVAMSRNGILPFSINDARFFTLILNAKALLSLFISSLPGIKYIFSKKWSPIKIKLSGTQIDVDFGKSVLADLLCNYCGVFTSYFSCWMLIGIMLNPTWGLTVTLLICFTFAAFTYAVYEYLTVFSREKGDKPNNWHALYPYVLGMLAVIFLIVIIVFAGQSYNGRETADETLKTTLLSALGAFVSWLSWKRLLNISQDLKEKQTQCPTSDSSTNCDYTHGQPSNAGDSLTGNGHATDNTNNIDHTQTQPPAEGDLAMVNGQTTKQIPSSSSDTSINSGNIQREATLGGDSSTDSATATEVHHPLFSGTCTNTQDIRRQSPLRGDSSTEVVVVVDIHQPPSHPTSTTKGQIRRLPPSAENNQSIDPNENLEIESSL